MRAFVKLGIVALLAVTVIPMAMLLTGCAGNNDRGDEASIVGVWRQISVEVYQDGQWVELPRPDGVRSYSEFRADGTYRNAQNLGAGWFVGPREGQEQRWSYNDGVLAFRVYDFTGDGAELVGAGYEIVVHLDVNKLTMIVEGEDPEDLPTRLVFERVSTWPIA